jgi:hypothetical protein
MLKEASNQLWLEAMAKGFAEILKLPSNWDSYGARQIDPECVKFAL